MNNLLQDLKDHVYLDNILILSESWFHHLAGLIASLFTAVEVFLLGDGVRGSDLTEYGDQDLCCLAG